jgi:hypothetical protein
LFQRKTTVVEREGEKVMERERERSRRLASRTVGEERRKASPRREGHPTLFAFFMLHAIISRSRRCHGNKILSPPPHKPPHPFPSQTARETTTTEEEKVEREGPAV